MGNMASIIGNSLPSCDLYKKHFEVLKLSENMRVNRENVDFMVWLLGIGDKKVYEKKLGP